MTVENHIVTYPKRILAIGEVLSFETYSKELLRLNKLNRVLLKRHRFNKPRYMYMSHKFMFDLLCVICVKKIWLIGIGKLIFIEALTLQNRNKKIKNNMKRGKLKTTLGIILLMSYYVKDILLLGWETSNILSFVLVLIFTYGIFIWLRS